MLCVPPALDCHERPQKGMYGSMESISRSCVPWNTDQRPREVKAHSLRFWHRNGVVGPKSWHHITTREVLHWYCIVIKDQELEERGSKWPYQGLIFFEWPKTELVKRRYKKLIWGPVNGPPRRKNGIFGANFGDLLLDIFEKVFFSNFFRQRASNPRVLWL